MDAFETCQEASNLLRDGREQAARNKLIQLLDRLNKETENFPIFLNQLLRETGLYPYMKSENARWDERFLLSAFTTNVGREAEGEPYRRILHREQSRVLRILFEGRSVAVSAPTSFGKSFVIDAYIANKKPKNVMIIVPTIALMEEMRRRLFRKFGDKYRMITTSDVAPGSNNIFVFPQERALSYIDKIDHLDLFVVDEFYKVSAAHDKERSSALFKATMKFSTIADQRYYLSPNIASLADNPLTKGMEFIELLKFNTVYLRRHDHHKSIGKNEQKKFEILHEILSSQSRKTLIYAGTYSEISKLAERLTASQPLDYSTIASGFATWVRENYSDDWVLADLADRKIGVHNGRMHRCLSQLQIRLFELPSEGINTLISTSSIIEGVNTSAESVVLWKNKIGTRNLTNFSYKNIIGRGGRMFKHFVGDVYILEKPPLEKQDQLEIQFPEEILGGLNVVSDKEYLSSKQIDSIQSYDSEMADLLGQKEYSRIKSENLISDTNSQFILELARTMKRSPSEWNGLAYLNSGTPSRWNSILYKIIRLKPGEWEGRYSDIVEFTHIIARNWRANSKDLISEAQNIGIDIEKFFQMERVIGYKLSALVSDVNTLHRAIIRDGTDVSAFAAKVGYAFLPKVVYQLEEIGLPRMLSKKIHRSGLLDFENVDLDLARASKKLSTVGASRIADLVKASAFEKFILEYFVSGVTPVKNT